MRLSFEIDKLLEEKIRAHAKSEGRGDLNYQAWRVLLEHYYLKPPRFDPRAKISSQPPTPVSEVVGS